MHNSCSVRQKQLNSQVHIEQIIVVIYTLYTSHSYHFSSDIIEYNSCRMKLNLIVVTEKKKRNIDENIDKTISGVVSSSLSTIRFQERLFSVDQSSRNLLYLSLDKDSRNPIEIHPKYVPRFHS
jgi:hypothetical protein